MTEYQARGRRNGPCGPRAPGRSTRVNLATYHFIVLLDLVHVVVKIMLVKARDLGSPQLPGAVVDLLVVIPMNMIVQGMHIGVLSA